MIVWEITGYELAALLDSLRRPDGRTLEDIRKVSVAIDGGVKVKVNEYVWSPPMGELKP
jgi:exosome complex RNA-binding protein Rrp42 (RNase PH superfamily)